MNKKISEINISSYRGINNLHIKNLSKVNLLVGDNNSGKTSILEALQIMGNPQSFNKIVAIARKRDRYRFDIVRSISIYESFLNIFDKSKKNMKISISCKSDDQTLKLELFGSIGTEIINLEDLNDRYRRRISFDEGINEERIDEEVDNFTGFLMLSSGEDSENPFFTDNVNFNKYTKLRLQSEFDNEYNVEYLSTIDHIVRDSFNKILADVEYTKEVITLLQIFDENIIDLRMIPDGKSYYQAIISKNLGTMPVSTYGDGIKKVITLANAVLTAKDGVLLIDEVETAIHPSVMEKVYHFLIFACDQLNVQLFVTTHSLEIVDQFISNCEESLDDLRVIKLKKNNSESYATVWNGEKVRKLRLHNDVELR